MTWTRTQCSVLAYSKEKLDPNSPGTSNALAAHRGLNPCVVKSKKTGNLLAFYSRGISHGAAGSVGCRRESADGGRTWGDTGHDERVILNYNPLWQSSIQTTLVLPSGRVLLAGFADDTNNSLSTPGTTAYAFTGYSDDDGITVTWVQFPSIDDYVHGTGLTRLPNGRILLSLYTRHSGKSGARSYCYYSDDEGATYNAFLTGGLGVIASDPNYITEYKEPTLLCMDNGTVLCLIRSDDSTQSIYSSFSTDGGPTWSAPTIAFPGWNIPSVIQTSDGTIVCATRHHTGLPSDGSDYSIIVTSPDRALTWSGETSLYDPVLGTGASAGCTAVELGPGKLGVIHGWAPPSAVFNVTRLEFIVLETNPESPGSFARYDIDYNVLHPSKYLSNVVAWYEIRSLRYNYQATGISISRWVNLMGDPRWDLIPGPNGGMHFDDGSDMITPPGLIGGQGTATNHAGNLNFAVVTPTTLTQPLTVIMVGDRANLVSIFTLWDDGNASPGRCLWQATSGGEFILSIGGVNQIFGPSTPPWIGIITSTLNGASSSVRYNGSAVPVISGGPLGNGSIVNFRPGGGGNANFWQGLREIVVARTADPVAIANYEVALLAKHRING